MFDLKEELLRCLQKQDALKAEPPKAVVRGGNSGILVDGNVVTSDAGSCLRSILLRSHGISAPKEFKSYLTFALGYAYEGVFEALKLSDRVSVETQVPLRADIEGSTVPFGGTADFLLTFRNGYRVLVDTKSVSALRSFADTFGNNKVKDNYIAQLVTYMDVAGINHGFIAPASFIYAPDAFLTAGTQRNIGRKVEPDIKVFDVRVDKNNITVDGLPWKYTLENIRAHRFAAAKAIEENRVAARPVAPEGGFHPCNLCPFRTACDEWDSSNKRTTENFLSLARQQSGGK